MNVLASMFVLTGFGILLVLAVLALVKIKQLKPEAQGARLGGLAGMAVCISVVLIVAGVVLSRPTLVHKTVIGSSKDQAVTEQSWKIDF